MTAISEESLAVVSLYTDYYELKAAKLRRAVEDHQSPLKLLAQHTQDRVEEALESAAHKVEHWAKTTGATVSTYLDNTYPKQLLDVWDYPPLVFTKGMLPLVDSIDYGVSIVGSRNISEIAGYFAEELTHELVNRGVTIVSGLAAGVDTIAHRTALSRGARTVGVIGTGIDAYYPPSSRGLQKSMESPSGHSMVLSQFLPGAEITKASFPIRNGVMSAYSQVSVIVEASEKSGTRHQAAQAVKHGRPIILSEQVARTTSWGATYAKSSQHEVYVAQNPLQAANYAVEILDRVQHGGIPKAYRQPSLELAF